MEQVISEIEELEVIISDDILFNKNDENKYYDKFDESISKGILKEGTRFDDDVWCYKHSGEEYNLRFPNELEFRRLSTLFGLEYEDFILAYKSFFLYNLNVKTINALNSGFKRIGRNNPEDKPRLVGLSGTYYKFLNYVKMPDESVEYLASFVNMENRKWNSEKVLPDFRDVFKFSDIINDIVENKGIENYKDYLITILWWKIASIVPLRPTEFMRTKFDCIHYDIEKQAYYLKVMRTKLKGLGVKNVKAENLSTIDKCYAEDIIVIDEHLYKLISNYKEILVTYYMYNDCKELFPTELLYNAEYYTPQAKARREKNRDLLTYRDLHINIINFYKNVVEAQYQLVPIHKLVRRTPGKENVEIQRLLPYDARHIAIMNLVLLGTDVLEVMYLAGHTDINTAYSYFNHVKSFARGYALGYSTYSKSKENVYTGNTGIEYETEKKDRFQYALDEVMGVKFEPIKITGGYYYYRNIKTDQSICHKLERKHGLCKFFKPDNDGFYQQEIAKVESQLDTDIKILKDLIEDMKWVSKFNELYNTTSFRIGNEVVELTTLHKKSLEC